MRRAVITGLGICAPGGIGQKEFWEFITSGRTATQTISMFDPSRFRSQMAAEVAWDPIAQGLSEHEANKYDRMVQFALVGLREAMQDSGLEAAGLTNPHRVGVSVGTAIGCTMGLERNYATVSDSGKNWHVDHERAEEWLFDYFVPTSLTRELAWEVGAEGPATVISTGCTSGMDSIGYALELIREGSADVVITGASDAPISPITVACFDAIRATSPSNHDPARACRPFDRDRNGFVLGEGAAIVILEEYEHAKRRGAHIYAELAGFATRCNAYHMTGLRADGREMAEAVSVAMGQARLSADAIQYISAHGSGTKQNDLHETVAVKKSLGQAAYGIPMSSIKSAIGHALGSVGAIELATCAMAIEYGAVPPTANLFEQDSECDLDYVPRVAREHKVGAALSVASGFGGFQSAAVLVRPKGRTA